MYSLKNIMVAMDFTSMDTVLIHYTAFLNHYLNPDKICFINIQPDLEIDEELRKKFPDVHQEYDSLLDESLTSKLRDNVKEHFPDFDTYNVEFLVEQGNPVHSLLKYSHEKDIDLLVMGRKAEGSGSGTMPQALSQKVMCSILLVPEVPHYHIDKILVPVDFSDYSKLALEKAISLTRTSLNPRIFMHHVYKLPIGYYKSGKSEEEFGEIMKENARKNMDKMIAEAATEKANIESVFTLEDGRSKSQLINLTAHKNNCDLIIIGARGRSNLSALFLGSISTRLINKDADIPLLIVKRKDKSFNFLDALLNI